MCVCFVRLSIRVFRNTLPREQVLNSVWVTGKKRFLYTFLVVILRTDNIKYISCYLLLGSRYNTVMAVSLSMRVVREIFTTTSKQMHPCQRSGIRYICCKNNTIFIYVFGRTVIYIIGPNVFKHRRRSVYTVVRFPLYHCVCVCVYACVIEELKSPGLAHPIVVKLVKVRI